MCGNCFHSSKSLAQEVPTLTTEEVSYASSPLHMALAKWMASCIDSAVPTFTSLAEIMNIVPNFDISSTFSMSVFLSPMLNYGKRFILKLLYIHYLPLLFRGFA